MCLSSIGRFRSASLVLGGVSGGDGSQGTTLVIAQDPAAGTMVDSGTAIHLVVADESGKAIAIDGVPFLVCRPVTTSGSFGDGLDEAWVFEEERVPGAGCIGSEGFQRLAIGSGSRVQVLSDRITDLLSEEAWKVWPYATPDLNGDGVDEIAVAKTGDQGASRAVWLLQLTGQQVLPVLADCGSACDPAPWSAMIGSINRADGTVVTGGVYCAPALGTGATGGVIEWRSSPDDPLTILETTYVLKDQVRSRHYLASSFPSLVS